MAYSILCRINTILYRVIKEIMIFSGLALIVLTFAGVITRYVLKTNLDWAYEVSILMLVWTAFLLLLVVSVPIGISLGMSSFIAVFAQGRFPLETVFHTMVSGLTSYILLSIPFFIIAGELMNSGGITTKIFDFANALVGRIPGGLAHANVVSSIIFAGMSGSAVADAGGLGAIELKAMKEKGFDDEFSAAVTAASSTIGPIIPPSIPMVVYAVAAAFAWLIAIYGIPARLAGIVSGMSPFVTSKVAGIIFHQINAM